MVKRRCTESTEICSLFGDYVSCWNDKDSAFRTELRGTTRLLQADYTLSGLIQNTGSEGFLINGYRRPERPASLVS